MTGESAAVSPDGESAQARSNAHEWASGRYLGIYDNNVLTPVEVQIFIRYRDELARRVLDIGCGAGRVLAYLLMLGAETHGVDLSPRMVEHCNRVLPQATVKVADARELRRVVDGRFDVVLAPDNLIDVFSDSERRAVIAEIAEILSPGGLFIFSTHDLAWQESNPGPRAWEQTTASGTVRKFLERSPADMIQAIRNRREIKRNRERLGPLQQRHADHAVINDFPHNYSLLHYYIRRDDQERQLDACGFDLIEALAADGSTVPPGGHGNTDSLYYVARARR